MTEHDSCQNPDCEVHGIAAGNARQSAFFAAADAAGTNDRAEVTSGDGVSRYDREQPATDELRERLRVVLAENGVDEAPATLHSWRCEYPERYGKCDCIAELVNDLVAVVAEARTEAVETAERIAATFRNNEDRFREMGHTSIGIEYSRKALGAEEVVAALRGVGNQNAEPRWSANRLEEVLREGLPDQNAEPVDKP